MRKEFTKRRQQILKDESEFDFEEYCELIKTKKNIWDQPEEEYKKRFIPKRHYKYWTFTSSHIDQNLDEICKGRIWMPNTASLNDPFEFQMLDDNLPYEQKMAFRKYSLGRNSILALSANYDNNLMWAHYSFAHTGLCLEFDVEETDRI